ncbi:hypothetical protein [Streptomyces sp. 1331.2]|uniref:hypothetical protein n=1 Tax=Streptomyces sp. 1331.2 TaxID=1938835 RepID=UPI000BD24D7A|nr:hypothetical protein [Streptomyces sp. 1331.2]SOB88446.1 hypothetical protein SAMN06272789_6727 [Streptomyces sp. 1331.2]
MKPLTAFGRTRLRPATLAAALAAVAALGTAGPAAGSARTESTRTESAHLLQCQGVETVGYDPALTFQRKPVTVTTNGSFSSCADSGAQVTSGSYAERFTIAGASCDDLLEGFTTRRTFRWQNGTTSVIEATGSSNAVAGQVITTITGTVVEGYLQGAKAVEVITLPQPGVLECSTTGVTGASGPTTLTVG